MLRVGILVAYASTGPLRLNGTGEILHLGTHTRSRNSIARSARVGYADSMTSPKESAPSTDPLVADAVRDPLAAAETVLAARRRPMSERLELALSWNTVAAELRAGLLSARHTDPSR
jgi:hypothetical protein